MDPNNSRAIDEVLSADAAFRDAATTGDADQLDALLSADFVYIHSSGMEDSRAEYLARARSGRVTYISRDVAGVVVRLHGDGAAVTGHTVVGFRRGDGPVEIRRSNFLAAWARQGGIWRLVAYAGAPLERI